MSDLPVLLRVVPGQDDDEEPDGAEQEQPEAAPESPPPPALVALQGGRMAWHEQAHTAVWHAVRAARLRARELSAREGGIVHGLLAAKPPSVLEQDAYARSRAWVPPGHDGGIAERAGAVYHVLAGRPGVAIGNAISGISARPLRASVAFLLTYLLTAVALYVLGLRETAVDMIIGLVSAVTVSYLALWLWPSAQEPERPREEAAMQEEEEV